MTRNVHRWELIAVRLPDDEAGAALAARVRRKIANKHGGQVVGMRLSKAQEAMARAADALVDLERRGTIRVRARNGV